MAAAAAAPKPKGLGCMCCNRAAAVTGSLKPAGKPCMEASAEAVETMEADTDYKINVFSLIEHGGELVRSDPLQARVCNGNRVYRLKSKVQLAAKRKTMSMSDLTMQVILKQQF